MNLEQILEMVQDFRSQMEVWGITNNILAAAAGIALVMLVLSLREVACWFLRVYQIRDEVKSLRKETRELRKTVAELHASLTAASALGSTTKPLNAEELLKKADFLREMTAAKSGSTAKFRLDH